MGLQAAVLKIAADDCSKGDGYSPETSAPTVPRNVGLLVKGDACGTRGETVTQSN